MPKFLSFLDVFVSYIQGLEKIWILGDEFVFRTIDEYFLQRDHKSYNGYSKEHYETLGFPSSKYASMDQNIISRIRNKFAKTVSDEKILPKLVVIVPDDDLIRCIHKSRVRTNSGIKFYFG